MKRTLTIAIIAACVGVFGCAADVPTEPTVDLTPVVAGPDTLTLTASTRLDSSVIVTALLADGRGQALTHRPVTFQAAAGSLAPAVSDTGVDGRASTIVIPDGLTRVTATSAELHNTIDLYGASTLPLNVRLTPSFVTLEDEATLIVIYANTTLMETQWDFGDGSTRTTASATTVTHVFRTGLYTVTARATDTKGRRATAETMVTVIAATPTPTPAPAIAVWLICQTSTTPPSTTVTAGCVVSVSGHATVQDVDEVVWKWGDGSTTTTRAPSATHIYPQSGTFAVYADVTLTTGQRFDPTATIVIP